MNTDTSASTAIILFTDLVGSTAIRSRLGDQIAEALRGDHDRILMEAVHAHYGLVVKGVGDGILATFPSGRQAINCAVAIQQAIDRYNRSRTGQESIGVRVGISAGDVTWEGGDVFGIAVNEGQRLCASATGGQILISETVRLLSAGQLDNDLVARGNRRLKGLTRLVKVWEVHWSPLQSNSTTVGVSHTSAAYILPRLLQQFRAAHPEMAVTAELFTSAAVIVALRAHRVELGLVGGYEPAPDLEADPFYDDEIVLVGPPSLGGRSVSTRDLANFTYLSREKGSSTRELVELGWRQLNVSLPSRLELPSWEALKVEAKRGGGFLACSRLVVDADVTAGDLVVLDVPEWHVRQTFSVVRLRGLPLEEPARCFLELLRRVRSDTQA